VFQRRPRVQPGGGTDLDTGAVGIGEENAAGTHARHLRQDLVVNQRDAEVGQPGRGGFDITRRRDVERHVVRSARIAPDSIVPPASEEVRSALRQARQVIQAVAERPSSPQALDAFNRLLAHGRRERMLTAAAPVDRVVMDSPEWTVPWLAADECVELLLTRPDRIKRCVHPRMRPLVPGHEPLGYPPADLQAAGLRQLGWQSWDVDRVVAVPIHLETARLCASADEALLEGSFRTGEFAEAKRLFSQTQAAGEQAGDLAGQARAVGGLAMIEHHHNIARLVAGTALALFGVSLVFPGAAP
jgi:hypothetical protein